MMNQDNPYSMNDLYPFEYLTNQEQIKAKVEPCDRSEGEKFI